MVILTIAGLFWWGKSAQNNVAGETGKDVSSSLVASEVFYDFGTIRMADGLVDHVFRVSNTSSEAIEIKTINTSCMCTTAFLDGSEGVKGPFGMAGMGYVPPANEIVGPGESRDVRVVYDPNAHGPAGVGSIDRFVYVIDENGSTLKFEIKAIVTP